MDGCHRNIRGSLLKVAILLAFIGFSRIGYSQGLGTPPSFTVQPLGLSVQNGGNATIEAIAYSFTAVNSQWYFNGQPIPTTNTTVLNVGVGIPGITGVTLTSTLIINKLSSANMGNYSLRLTNAVGSAISSNAAVIVLGNVVTSTVSNVVNFVTSGIGLTAKGFNIQLSAPTGSNVVIQASTDCKTWVPISTNTATGGSVSYTDTAAASLPLRYYRALIK